MDASLFGVGAGYVQLISGQTFGVLQYSNYLSVIFSRVSEHIGEDRGPEAAEHGQLFLNKSSRSDVLQPDGIDHAPFGFPEARGRIPFNRLAREAFYHDAADGVQVRDFFEFDSVPVGPGCGNYGILEFHAAEGGT